MLNNWIKQSDNRMLLFVLLFVCFNAIAFFTKSDSLMQLVEPILMLLILFFFLYKYSNIGLVLIGVIIFTIIGDLSYLFNLKVYGIRVEAIAYSLAYLCLIYEAIYNIKKLNISLMIGVYLVIVFVTNTYILYTFYSILEEIITNNIELSFVALRVVFLLLFSLFSFTLYLSSESRQSILLLLMSISLLFSDILYLISEYYMYFWIFDLLSKSLYLVTFYCFYLYVVSLKKVSLHNKIKGALT